MKNKRIFITILLFSSICTAVSSAETFQRDTGGEVAARIRSYVANELAVDFSEIQISRADPVNGRKYILPGKVVRVQPATRGSLLGRMVFVVSMVSEKGHFFSQWIRADIEQVREVLVARTLLRRHQIIDREDLEIEKIRVRRQKNRYETNIEKLVGKRMIRPLRKGLPILSDFVEEAPVIRRGERVTITLQAGGLQISTLGKAKEDGRMGEVIQVMNLDSKNVVFAEVVRPGDVRISFGNDSAHPPFSP